MAGEEAFMEIYEILLLNLLGIGAGFINTIGGGGSVITVSMMIFFGIPSAVANGTNRIALLIQNISAVYSFKRKDCFDLKMNLTLAIPAIAGSVIGANIAVNISDQVFNKILAIIMVLILFQILLKPQKKLQDSEGETGLKYKIPGQIIFFFIGLYGGIIQAGVGFIIIAAMSFLTDYDLVRINAAKVFIVGAYTISSLLVFILNGKVDFLLGFCLAAGNGIGAYLGSIFAVSKGEKWIKILLTIMILAMVVRLLVQ